jgi:hypothetical protein
MRYTDQDWVLVLLESLSGCTYEGKSYFHVLEGM